MKNSEIYAAALRLIAEDTTTENFDYEDRAYYILATFCCDINDINNELRASKGLPKLPISDALCLTPNACFPCQPRLKSAAVHYLAAMLTIDSFPELSDKLYEKYCDIISSIQDKLPMLTEKISDVYLF